MKCSVVSTREWTSGSHGYTSRMSLLFVEKNLEFRFSWNFWGMSRGSLYRLRIQAAQLRSEKRMEGHTCKYRCSQGTTIRPWASSIHQSSRGYMKRTNPYQIIVLEETLVAVGSHTSGDHSQEEKRRTLAFQTVVASCCFDSRGHFASLLCTDGTTWWGRTHGTWKNGRDRMLYSM